MRAAAPNLADVRWTWRRVFALVVVLTNGGLLWSIVGRLADPAALRSIAHALIASDALAALLYMAGATTTDVMRLVTAWKAPPASPIPTPETGP